MGIVLVYYAYCLVVGAVIGFVSRSATMVVVWSLLASALPNAVAVYQLSRSDGWLYFAMYLCLSFLIATLVFSFACYFVKNLAAKIFGKR